MFIAIDVGNTNATMGVLKETGSSIRLSCHSRFKKPVVVDEENCESSRPAP